MPSINRTWNISCEKKHKVHVMDFKLCLKHTHHLLMRGYFIFLLYSTVLKFSLQLPHSHCFSTTMPTRMLVELPKGNWPVYEIFSMAFSVVIEGPHWESHKLDTVITISSTFLRPVHLLHSILLAVVLLTLMSIK